MRLAILGGRSTMPYLEEFGAELASQGIQTDIVETRKPANLNSEVSPLGLLDLATVVPLLRRADAVFADDPSYGAALAHFQRKRLLMHLRGHVWSESYWRKARASGLQERTYNGWKYLLRMKCLEFADVLLPTCKWLTRETTNRLPNKPAYTLYQGINCETWMRDSGNRMQIKHPALITVFNFDVYPKVRGLLDFIENMKHLGSVNLYIAGEGPYRPKNVNASNVHFLGRLSYPVDVKRLYYSGDLYVHPSGQDCCPIVLLEASLCGLPILTTGVGGIPEIVKDGQTGCIVEKSSEWKDKILNYLSDQSEANRLAKNAQKFVADNFCWERIVKNLIPILHSHINSAR